MAEINEVRHRRLIDEVLPMLAAQRASFQRWRWPILLGLVAVPAAGIVAASQYLWKSKPQMVDAMVVPALTGLAQQIWSYDGKLRRLALAIRLGEHEALSEAITGIGFHFSKLDPVINHVEQILDE